MGEAGALRVFIAEDNDDLAHLMERSFASRAWRVVRARTSAEARERLHGDRFDLVVLDYLLPDGNGLDLLRVVRAETPATPVLFLTAHGSEDVALRALGLGASDYMQKSGAMLEELPQRAQALVEREADLKQAARVVAVQGPDARPDRARSERGAPDASTARALLEETVKGDILGAGIFDGSGAPIAAILPSGMDAAVLGASLFQVHAQVGVVGRLNRLAPLGYRFVMDVDGGTLAATSVSGRAIVVVLVKGAQHAEERLAILAKRVR